jgi:hypothetical protein
MHQKRCAYDEYGGEPAVIACVEEPICFREQFIDVAE